MPLFWPRQRIVVSVKKGKAEEPFFEGDKLWKEPSFSIKETWFFVARGKGGCGCALLFEAGGRGETERGMGGKLP